MSFQKFTHLRKQPCPHTIVWYTIFGFQMFKVTECVQSHRKSLSDGGLNTDCWGLFEIWIALLRRNQSFTNYFVAHTTPQMPMLRRTTLRSKRYWRVLSCQCSVCKAVPAISRAPTEVTATRNQLYYCSFQASKQLRLSDFICGHRRDSDKTSRNDARWHWGQSAFVAAWYPDRGRVNRLDSVTDSVASVFA